MKHQDMMDSLLSLGLQRGKITCQELNDAFPAEFLPLDELERFLSLLDGLGVRVIVIQRNFRREKARRNHLSYKGQLAADTIS